MSSWRSNEKQQIIKKLNNKNIYSSTRFIMRYKYFTAQLIKYLFPKVYEQMELDQLIDQYMVNTNSSFKKKLQTTNFRINRMNSSKELLSVIGIPSEDRKKNLLFFLVYDTDTDRNSLKEQSLRNEIKAISWNLFRLQSTYYKEFCPVCVVWIMPKKEDQPFKLEYWNDSRSIQFNDQIVAEKFPLENNFIIRLGEPEDKEDGEELAYFLNTLFGKSQKKILELTEKLNIPLTSAEARIMSLFEIAKLLEESEENNNYLSYDKLLSIGMPKRYDPAIVELFELLKDK